MKKVNSTVLVVFAMALVSILCLLLGKSYSYILSNGSASNTETINTGNLNATINYNAVTYEKMPVSSDVEAMELDNYATVTISKDNQYSVYYQLNLEYTSTFQTNDINSYLPLENVVVALYELKDGQANENNLVIGPIRVADLPIVKCDTNDETGLLKAQYQLYVGKFNTGNQKTEYALKAWIASDTDEEFNGRQVSLDLTVNQEPYHSQNVYNLSFNVSGGTGEGTTEVILNGKKATSDNDGYKITDVVAGTYTLIVKKGSNTYETTLSITGGTDNNTKLIDNPTRTPVASIAEIKPQVEANQILQHYAFEHKITVYQIMKRNPSLQNSNVRTPYPIYNLPKSYEITAPQSLDVQDINGITLTLGDQNKDITITLASTTALGDDVDLEGEPSIADNPNELNGEVIEP